MSGRKFRVDPTPGPKVKIEDHLANGRITPIHGVVARGFIIVSKEDVPVARTRADLEAFDVEDGVRRAMASFQDPIQLGGEFGIVVIVPANSQRERQMSSTGGPANGDGGRPKFLPTYPHGAPNPGDPPRPRELRNTHPDAPVVVATAVVDHLGRFLVGFNRKLRVWDVPGGGCEPGEDPADAAARELREEAGVNADPRLMYQIAQFRHQTHEFPGVWQTRLYMIGDVPGVAPPDLAAAETMEKNKFVEVAWMAPIQIPQPRGLSLRMALGLTGHQA